MSETSAVEAPGRDFSIGSVEADGFKVRYWEAGEGDAVVWIHGAGGPQFSHALDLLTRSHRVIAVELPGFGESAINDRTANAAEMAGTVAQVIEAMGLAPTHVWGTSMGGVVATHLAVNHPGVVRSLVVEGPGPFRRGGPNPAQLTPEEMVRAFNLHPERVAHRTPAPPDPERWALVMRLMGEEHDAALEGALAGIQAPTLAFWGVGDGIIPPAAGRIYKEHIPQCSYVLVHGAAHDVQGDRPEACAELVGDFLARGLNFAINDRDGRINP
ncbi:MAG TPA: alpha/beta hydrolase [Baekduia sp.]|nr:alpha/beta hydrolase [Baekduia sp.]